MQYIIMLTIVLGMAVTDFLTGIIKGYVNNDLSSTKMRKGGLNGILKPWRSTNKLTYYTPDDGSTVDMTHPNSPGHKAIAMNLQSHFIDNTI